MQSDGSYGTLSPVVHGDIALSINTQYNTIQYTSVVMGCSPGHNNDNKIFVSI